MNDSRSPERSEQTTGRDWMEEQFLPIIQQLELTTLQREFLRHRWLDQVRWAEGKAGTAQRWYRVLRLTTIVGGVLIPALIGLDLTEPASEYLRWAIFCVGLVVAFAASIEGFFHYGDRWPHYRRTAELLKSEGWQFFQLSGQYEAVTTHAAAYAAFAAQTEAIVQRDIEVFFTAVVPGQEKERPDAAPVVPAQAARQP
ncbi:DUF4231 domain-containing protein [Virgisporangium aurantiacum]|uniref:DUF4231 domain-containing protein n=1 Tax=Virgisporangium aurantiacum TaxID=175570 RepID=A0A8J4E2T0_9ACTN|nr:DUF4231 domain-containing protein [Virgisporangium aurantiacum]GIJ57327.1 hypothetical protein Vau01_048430 [Virgisporangium aurantiacum]